MPPVLVSATQSLYTYHVQWPVPVCPQCWCQPPSHYTPTMYNGQCQYAPGAGAGHPVTIHLPCTIASASMPPVLVSATQSLYTYHVQWPVPVCPQCWCQPPSLYTPTMYNGQCQYAPSTSAGHPVFIHLPCTMASASMPPVLVPATQSLYTYHVQWPVPVCPQY